MASVSDFKSILVGITEEGTDRASSALAYGLSFAQAAGAHITVQAAALKVSVPRSAVGHFAAELAGSENRRVREAAVATVERARGEADASGLTCSVETLQLPLAELLDAFVGQARVHDIAVLETTPEPMEIGRDIIENVVTRGGRPVLAVPPGVTAFRAERIVIAWDGSERAARAVAFALPLLKAAQEVEILCIKGEKDLAHAVPGAELAPNLARHGVKVSVNDISVRDGDAAETLRGQVGLFRGDMVVMGAFVHSRLQQWVLGGFTRALIERSPVPLFLAH
ncbi:universal stress protein [Roseixanthobacter liquoris]|uniref:universal stress protein n=1 Tax=Roseixanthobacter liquoris TaxID=3119921 RepID=UPI003726DF0E